MWPERTINNFSILATLFLLLTSVFFENYICEFFYHSNSLGRQKGINYNWIFKRYCGRIFDDTNYFQGFAALKFRPWIIILQHNGRHYRKSIISKIMKMTSLGKQFVIFRYFFELVGISRHLTQYLLYVSYIICNTTELLYNSTV